MVFGRNNQRWLSVLVFVLGGVFFLLALGVVIFGSNSYANTVDAADTNYQNRTGLSYLVNQLRRSDAQSAIGYGEFDGAPALVLSQEAAGSTYVTYLYCWDGMLRELFMEEGTELGPESGVPILEMASLSYTVDTSGDALTLHATDASGGQHAVSIAPRCGLEEVGAI